MSATFMSSRCAALRHALRFSRADPVWTPPRTFDARPDLGGLNQAHPDGLARSSERPVGPTTETGVPPSTNEPVPPTVPATTVEPMTVDAAKRSLRASIMIWPRRKAAR